MACIQTFRSAALTLEARSMTPGTPTWITTPQPTAGLQFVDAVLVCTDVQGFATAMLVTQFFETNPNEPGTPAAVGGAAGGVAKVYADVSTAAGQNAFYRLGVVPVLSSGSTVSRLSVQVDGTVRRCGSVIASESVEVSPMPANKTRFVPISGLFPARQFSTVSMVIRVLDLSSVALGELGTKLVSRTFTSDRWEPDPWTDVEGSFTTGSDANSERFVDAVSPGLSPNTKMWGQLGLALQADENDLSAVVQVLVLGAS